MGDVNGDATIRRVTIVGGGIAGMTLAAVLDPQRFDVTLIEDRPDRAQAGSALGVWPSARRVLEGLDAWDLIAEHASPPATAALHDVQGRIRLREKATPLRLVERPHLLAALAAVVPDSVHRAHETVEDAASLDGDLVVGADGVRSVVRSLVARNAARIETPYVALRGIRTLTPAERASVSFGEYWGDGTLFGIMPVTDDRAYWFTTHRSTLGPEPLDPGAVVAEIRRLLPDTAAPVVTDTLDRAGAGTLATRLWLAPPMRRYVRGRYVVIGDAAHASLPNLGRGACDAILDAASLGRALNDGSDLRLWQARRLPFTQAARIGASAAMRLALSGARLPRRD